MLNVTYETSAALRRAFHLANSGACYDFETVAEALAAEGYQEGAIACLDRPNIRESISSICQTRHLPPALTASDSWSAAC
jgi:hypothetical protein